MNVHVRSMKGAKKPGWKSQKKGKTREKREEAERWAGW
jgi:hypothetical protein